MNHLNTRKWRLLNSGFLSASENMALDNALLSAHDKGESPDTLRLMFFKSDAALVGFHQCVNLEIDTDFCEMNGIEINRRITGGGAILMQPCHIGFEIVCNTDSIVAGLDRRPLYRILSNPVVNTLQKLGLNAAYRPLNDIEVNGKKLSGTGGVDGSRSFLFHGSLLLDMDLKKMLQVLKIPMEKISDKALNSIQERMTTINHELGKPVEMDTVIEILINEFSRELSIDFYEDSLNEAEQTLLNVTLPDYQSDKWIHKVRMPADSRETIMGIQKAEGGLIRAVLVMDNRSHQIQSVMISGDFFTSTPHILRSMEARLKGTVFNPGHIRWIIHQHLTNNEHNFPDVTADDFVQAVLNACSNDSTGS